MIYRRLLFLLAALCLPAQALAQPVNYDDAAAGLLHDLEVIVAIQTQRGWEIDRQELVEMIPTALESVCRTSPEVRVAAMQVLLARESALGGPPEVAFRKARGHLSALEDLLAVQRARLLLFEAERRTTEDCPWYLAAQPAFLGRQTNARRTVLHLDGGGLGTLRNSTRGWSYGGGGSGRLMVGRGFSTRLTLLSGPEIGGAALLDETNEQQRIRVQAFAAVPVVMRWSFTQWHFDLEAAPVLQFSADGEIRGLGLRGGLLLAIGSLRVLDVLPWAGFGLNFEQMLTGSAGASDEQSLRAGFRVGLDWDFGAPRRDRAAHGF